MKKIIIIFLIIIFLFNSLFAQKKKFFHNSMYIGYKLGWSKYNDLEKINKKFQNNNKNGKGFFIGYKANKNLSFEFGYDLLGQIKEKKKFNTYLFKTQGLNLVSKINLPIFNNLDIYTKLGGIITNSIYSEENKIKKNKKDFIDTRISPLISLGIEYKINSYLFSRIDYQWIYNIGNKYFLKEEPNNNFLNFNLIYKYKNNIKKNNKIKNLNFYIKFNKNKFILNNINTNKLNYIFEKNIFINKYIYKIKIINYILNKKNKFNKLKSIYKKINCIEKYFLKKGIDYSKLNKKIYYLNFKKNKKKIFNNYTIIKFFL